MKNKIITLSTLFVLTGCTLPSWLGAGEEPKLPGDRYAVMSLGSSISVSNAMQHQSFEAPEPINFSDNNIGNVVISGNDSAKNSTSVGSAPDDGLLITNQVAFDPSTNLIFTLDGSSKLTALTPDLQQVWQTEFETPEDKEGLPGGGIAIAGDKIFITTGYGALIAFDLGTGTELWRKDFEAPIRNAPVIADDKILFTTSDNRLLAASINSGEILWRHTGVSELTAFYGSASPAVKDDLAVVAYSSGEVFGINNNQGRENWTELIALGGDAAKAASILNDVTATPLIVDGIVYVTSHSDNLSAFNISNGFRIWEQPVGSGTTPWVADKFIFIVSNKNELVALNRFDGRVKWVTELPFEDEDESAIFTGPILAGGSLYVVSNQGALYQFSPDNGSLQKTIEIEDDVYSPPLAAFGSIYLLSNDANLIKIY